MGRLFSYHGVCRILRPHPIPARIVNHWHLKQAARVIRHGGIVAYPTESVFGLGCDPLRLDAVARLLDLKRRSPAKGLILIAHELQALLPYVEELDPAMRERIVATWPGPRTWLLPARPEVPFLLRGVHDTIAVRVTAHPVAAALCRECGHALVSTSANIAGHPPARTALGVRRSFGNTIDYVLPGEPGGAPVTEIRDARSGRIVRAA
jgi:L-threonylcarbamoyladenylate synthase